MENKAKEIKEKRKRIIPAAINDGMNTPVRDKTATQIPSASEVALLKQAENPLGDPHKK